MATLLSASFAAWRQRREDDAVKRQAAAGPCTATVRSGAASLPHGTVAVAQEIRTALALAGSIMRSRGIDLQMAVQPSLIVYADFANYRACMRQLFESAIDRAASGVLVTAVRCDDSVEIGILDDGGDAAVPENPAHPWGTALPAGGVMVSQSCSAYGTTLLLRLPLPNRHPASPVEADAGFAVSADA